MPTLVSRPRPTVLGARGARAAFAALCATATLSACGGGGGGDGGTGPNAQGGSATVTVAGTILLAQGTTGAQLQITPAYERASGDPVAYSTQTVAVSGAATQQVPVTVDLASCLADATRKSAEQGAVCVVRATVSLVAGDRVLDTQAVGPVTLRAGQQTSQAVTLAEVASVRVSAPAGTTVGSEGKAQVLVGQTYTFTAQPLDVNGGALGGRLVRWASSAPGVAAVDAATGVVTPGASGTATLTASVGTRNGTLDVAVSRPPSPVAVSVAGGAGTGTVTSSPAGISCTVTGGAASGTCTANFAAEQAVTLTAAPGANSSFVAWSRDCAAATGALTCTLPASAAARTAGVAFAAVQPLAVTVAGSGAGRVSSDPAGIDCQKGSGTCSRGFNDGTNVTLTASSDGGSAFAGWSGACTGAGTCTVAMTQARNVTATFNTVPADTITVTAEGPPGLNGSLKVAGTTVAGAPFNSALIINLNTSNSAPQFTFYVAPGTQASLTFTANAGATFTAWDGACAGTATTAACTPTPRNKNAVVVRLAP